METSTPNNESSAGSPKTDIFSFETGPDGVCVITMDVPGEPVNTLGGTMGDEIRRNWPRLMDDPNVKAFVFISGKKDNFIAGANIEMLATIKTADEGVHRSREAQAMFDQMAASHKPIIAAINGSTLGGGLELALACHYRMASDDKKTKLGLPEVMLGLIPGAGGTQRLPALIGAQAAMDMILTGKELTAKKALQLGVVDEVMPKAILLETARKRAAELASGKKKLPMRGVAALMEQLKKGKPDQKMLTALALEQNFVGRKVLFAQAEKLAFKKARGNYPAIPAALEAIRYGLEHGLDKGLQKEAELFGNLVISNVSRMLTTIFFGQTALKKDPGVDNKDVKPLPVKQVAVLGGGLMGGGIAYVTAAQARIPVRIKEKDHAGIGRGLLQVRGLLDERVKRKSITPMERDRLMASVTGGTDYAGFKTADVVIEAVFEDLALKHKIMADVEAVVKDTCIFASNTSTLPITRLASGSKRPHNVVGMHYFSPVNKMPLLEVIRGKETSDVAVATAVALGKAQGKTVIVVNDGPGFYTSRILAPYVNEAAWLLQDGGDIKQIDDAMVDWGFPVGPVMLLDEVGIDVAQKASKTMKEAFGDRMVMPEGFDKLTENGRLGRKSNKGFYVYAASDGKKKKEGDKEVDATVYDLTPQGRKRKSFNVDEIQQRLSLQFCNEAALCLQEGIIRGPRDGDVGAIFGLGFAPFRGGPFRYMDSLGAAEVVKRLRAFEQKFGRRFAPAQILLDMAAKSERFHKQ
jgi:3-hydroxyacyl-CoA dehydrogenase/enoyl-CoA hydratase/3-hydroxybutyryl-CoA epimerase